MGGALPGSLGEWLRKLSLASAFLVIDPGVQRLASRAIACSRARRSPMECFSGMTDMEAGAENSLHAEGLRRRWRQRHGYRQGDRAAITNGGRVRDYNGTNSMPKDLMPLICIPTTAGTGGEVTANIAVANADTHEKMSVRSPRNYPRLALRSELLRGPSAVAAASGLDALVHAIEM